MGLLKHDEGKSIQIRGAGWGDRGGRGRQKGEEGGPKIKKKGSEIPAKISIKN